MRKCNRLCDFSTPQGECRKPSDAACPAGLPTNEQRIRAMDLDCLARVVTWLTEYGGEAICANLERCGNALNRGEDIPDAWCDECAKVWLRQVAEEEDT